ncbi:MAG TPA: polymer-forming cytoskeletal protein [Herpetosiphonaceae bacterium]
MQRHTYMFRRVVMLVAVALVAALLGAAPALAADRRSGERVVIGANEVIPDDLYVAANTIIVDGTIQGDLLAVGANVTINGTVEGDLMAAGQAVVINGTVRDDVRVGGMAIQFGPQAQIGDDVLGGATSIEQQAGSTFGGDAYLGGSQTLLAGTTRGSVEGGFAALELRGTVGRDVNVTVGGGDDLVVMPWSPGVGIAMPAVRSGLTVDDGAQIGGKLSYTAPQDGQISAAAKVENGITRTPTPTTTALTTNPYHWLIDLLRRYVTLLAVGLLLLWLVPTWIGALGTTVRSRPLATAGWGAVGFLGTIVLLGLIPFVAILLMVVFGWLTLGGLAGITFVLGTAAFSTVLTGFAILVSYLVQVIVGLMVGRWLLGLIDPRWAEGRVGPLALGLALYVVLRAVPMLGILTALIVTLLGVGALWQWLVPRLRRGHPAPPPWPAMSASQI